MKLSRRQLYLINFDSVTTDRIVLSLTTCRVFNVYNEIYCCRDCRKEIRLLIPLQQVLRKCTVTQSCKEIIKRKPLMKTADI